MKLHELYQIKPLPFDLSQTFHSLGVVPKELEDTGVTVCVEIEYPRYCKDSEVIKINEFLYDNIQEHRDSFTFVTLMGIGLNNLEDIKTWPCNRNSLWVKIKDRSSMGENHLIFTPELLPNQPTAI